MLQFLQTNLPFMRASAKEGEMAVAALGAQVIHSDYFTMSGSIQKF
ncbi:MAG TPA: hypothetical protein VJ750_09435 [Rhizomicrobium sp.]|nr:hypothetical protein [Rhizomicrobium sp.]